MLRVDGKFSSYFVLALKMLSQADAVAFFVDIREHDLPYHVRVSIDKSIYVGSWYQVKSRYRSNYTVKNVLAYVRYLRFYIQIIQE
jgi:DNA polymerase epsilon subunit 1